MTELDLLVSMILKHPDKTTGDYTITISKKLMQLAATELAQIRAEQKLHPKGEFLTVCPKCKTMFGAREHEKK
ncbi:MAG: hypothetical protein ABSG01_08985 [Anaerolineales bacterium]